MSTFTDRPATALLVIDVQRGVVATALRHDEVVATIADLVESARAAAMPVVWVQHSDEGLLRDSDDWQLVDELVPLPQEPVVHKGYRSSFIDTDLDEVLASLGAGALVICGAETNNCVRHTLHTALDRGYDVTLVEDAHTTSDIEWNGRSVSAAAVIEEQNLLYDGYELPGRTCRVVPAAAVFAPA